MDLTYAPEDREFRGKTRRWLETNTPTHELKTLDERKGWHRKLYEAGYVGMQWPREYGGWGATPMQQAIGEAEMARVGGPPAINGLGIGFIGPTIIVHGTEAQKKRYLKKMLTAEEIWCQLYSEPNAGSDLASLKTRAEDQGDHFVVNGQKIWTSSGPIADWGILRARMGRIFADLEVQRYAALRVLSALQKGDAPGAASSITKLSYTEFEKRYYELALEILGPFGQLMVAREEFEEVDTSSGEPGTFATAFLWSRAGTIYSGSSEIQKNIIGERVLGLPKEVRADRLKA